MNNLENSLGIWQITSSNLITDIVGAAGFELVLVDFEHGLNNPNTLQDIVFAAKNRNLFTIARVPSIDYENISNIIDTGINGILYPHIESEAQLKKIFNATLLPPDGNRGFSPFVPRFNYKSIDNTKNKNPKVGILIESIKGLENLDALLNSSLVDFVYFGAYDLSVEIGKHGDIFENEIINYLKDFTNLCCKYKKKSMAIFRNLEELKLLINFNITNPIASVDTNIFFNALKKEVECYKNSIY